MNKGYVYINGQCVVSDDSESGIKEVTTYNENIEEILIQDNIIKALEKKLTDNQKKGSILGENIKDLYKLCLPALVIGALVMPFLGALIYIGTENFSYISKVLSTFPVSALAMITLGGIFSLPVAINKKDLKGMELQNQYIEQKLQEEKEKLNQLLQKPKTTNLSATDLIENQIHTINDSEIINAQNTHLNIFFNCGENSKLFKRLKRNGSLKLTLQREGLSDSEIQMITDYLKPKRKVLNR